MSICWYCEKNAADEGSSKKIKLYKKLGVTGYRRTVKLHYVTEVVAIPCCSLCKESYARVNRFVTWAIVLSLLAGVLLALLVGYLNPGNFGLTEVIIGIVAFALGIAISRNQIKKTSVTFVKGKDFRKYPTIAEKLAEGWSDSKPSL